MVTGTKIDRNTDGYRPMVIPQALKVIERFREGEILLGGRKEIDKDNNTTGKGRDKMSEQAVVNIDGASFVLLVKNLEQTIQFYSELGFKHEVIGEKVPHHHVSRDKLTFILVEARQEDEVKPISYSYEEQYFDVFCYTNAVDLLAQEFMERNVTIVKGPNYDSHWSEVTIRDFNGYQIAFGGGIVNKELISG